MTSWNHNTHYHRLVLNAIPPCCERVLDVGCGQGSLARTIARQSREVIGIDLDHEALQAATRNPHNPKNLAFIEADVLTEVLRENTFDCVVAVAALHHLPLHSALLRFHNLLRPGGVLVIIGLRRMDGPIDFALAAAALPISRVIRLVRGEAEVGAPIQNPTETLAEIRKECDSVLPGHTLRRRLFFRYSLIWRKPVTGSTFIRSRA